MVMDTNSEAIYFRVASESVFDLFRTLDIKVFETHGIFLPKCLLKIEGTQKQSPSE